MAHFDFEKKTFGHSLKTLANLQRCSAVGRKQFVYV